MSGISPLSPDPGQIWRAWREAADVGSRSFRCHPLEIGLCEKYKVEVVISNLIDEESCEGKNRGESERGKGAGECQGKRRAVVKRKDNAESSAISINYLLSAG